MNVNEMTKKQLIELKYFNPTKEFNAVVIVPNGLKHDSGFECMEFVLCYGTEVVGKVGGGSDVININGIGGYGDWRKGFKTLVKPIDWSIDCLSKSHLLRLFSSYSLTMPEFVLSNFEIFAKVDNE